MLSNITTDENQQGLGEDENMIEFNYNNIVKEDSPELSVINDFVHLNKQNIGLLKHPLLQAMVMMKWRTFQWLWLIELILQLLFTSLMFSIGTSVLKIEPNEVRPNSKRDQLCDALLNLVFATDELAQYLLSFL